MSLKIGITVAIAFGALGLGSAMAATDHPWQQLQMPTAAQVQAVWNDPPPEYGPEPYYGLGGHVTLDVINRDLDNMYKTGWRAVTVQYGRGAGDYMSPAYMKLFREFVEAAKAHHMRVWIVDDAGYPSGFAGGKFNQVPDLSMQILMPAETLAVSEGETVDRKVPDGIVSVTAFPRGGAPVSIPVSDGRVHWTAPKGYWTVYFVIHAHRTSPTRSATNPTGAKDETDPLEDYLNPAATAQYLAFTHDVYKKWVGDEFGKTIMGFRGDEPDFTVDGLPWTQDFFATFEKDKGYDVRPYVAALLRSGTPRGPMLKVKADYYDVFARMFRDGFFKPQAEWCAQNGLEYQVHINHEERQLDLVHSEGDFFRAMQYVQVPGVDTIWHQIWTDTIADFPRLASSAAHIYGHPRAFTESFAAYHPTPDLKMARYVLNEQMIRGINLVETMYYPASSSPRRGPPAFMRDPQYADLMGYVRRLSYLTAMGHPDAQVALLLPTASLWMGDERANDMFMSSERLLSEQQVDFDIVTEDAIDKTLTLGPGTLETMSGNRYRTVIVPAAKVLSQDTVDRLKAFVTGGGHVLFIGGTPDQIAGQSYLHDKSVTPADFSWATLSNVALNPVPVSLEGAPYVPPVPPGPLSPPAALVETLHQLVPPPQFQLATPDTAVRYMHRRLKDATVMMLFNESDHAVHNKAVLDLDGSRVELWDPQTGQVHRVDATRTANGFTLPLDLPAYATAVYVVRH